MLNLVIEDFIIIINRDTHLSLADRSGGARCINVKEFCNRQNGCPLNQQREYYHDECSVEEEVGVRNFIHDRVDGKYNRYGPPETYP